MNVKVGEFDMAQFKVYQENYSDVTVVSNIFIDEYMKEAKAINNIFIINVSISIKLYRNPYTF